MVPVGNSSASTSVPTQPAAAQESTSVVEKKEEPEDVKGDPEMAPVYLKNLLPLFAKNYKETMMPSIRKATLALMRKMIHYASQAQLEELSQNSTFASVIVEVLSVVLDHEVSVSITIKKMFVASKQTVRCNYEIHTNPSPCYFKCVHTFVELLSQIVVFPEQAEYAKVISHYRDLFCGARSP